MVEYGRSAHAEIIAITSAARDGVAIKGATLYVTTLPCHECIRSVVAAGIDRVVYLEPYPKSRGAELHDDSVALVSQHGDMADRLRIEPFSGISHTRFGDLFSMVPRKQDDSRAPNDSPDFEGRRAEWDAVTAPLRKAIFCTDFQNAELMAQLLKEAEIVGLSQPG